LMQGLPGNLAERLGVLPTQGSNIGGHLGKRLASRFHLPPHIGSAETRGGVNALLLWEAPLLLPTGSSKGAWSRLVQP
jgi:hypothetical protein